MKLIVAGATGFLGREVVRHALATPAVTCVVALARNPVSFTDAELLPSSDRAKLVHAAIRDYGEYPPDVTAHFVGADACIWTVGVNPAKALKYDWPEVVRICQTCTVQGFSAMLEATMSEKGDDDGGASRAFRFVYVSGMVAQPDQTKKPFFSPQYALMRGQTETDVLALAAKYQADRPVSAAACRFGLIAGTGWGASILGSVSGALTGWPALTAAQGAKVLIDQAVNGFYEGKGTLVASDLAAVLKRIE